ncbi:hypothetical protein N656DRAFT_84796 [Canariomyces notabilis]|uniref:Uncharacterized protein n=1 Tax=Canariomyces notabilis TaxID=2074819 RepID=A0AAN6TDB8_9PEZI|nr:hypothetical protein N656DRAFT_84796 [Canariomyces arenarius]
MYASGTTRYFGIRPSPSRSSKFPCYRTFSQFAIPYSVLPEIIGDIQVQSVRGFNAVVGTYTHAFSSAPKVQDIDLKKVSARTITLGGAEKSTTRAKNILSVPTRSFPLFSRPRRAPKFSTLASSNPPVRLLLTLLPKPGSFSVIYSDIRVFVPEDPGRNHPASGTSSDKCASQPGSAKLAWDG